MNKDIPAERSRETTSAATAPTVGARHAALDPAAREMPCPQCGHPMPDLKGGKDSICPICGFKDSCCY